LFAGQKRPVLQEMSNVSSTVPDAGDMTHEGPGSLVGSLVICGVVEEVVVVVVEVVVLLVVVVLVVVVVVAVVVGDSVDATLSVENVYMAKPVLPENQNRF